MIIYIEDIKRDLGTQKSFCINDTVELSGEIGADKNTKATISANLKITNAGKFMLLTGQMSCTLNPVCCRCLENFELNLSIDITEEFRLKKQSAKEKRKPGETSTSNDDFFFEYSGSQIDISEALRQNILLNLPSRYLCDSACKGLCGSCGINKNLYACQCEKTD